MHVLTSLALASASSLALFASDFAATSSDLYMYMRKCVNVYTACGQSYHSTCMYVCMYACIYECVYVFWPLNKLRQWALIL